MSRTLSLRNIVVLLAWSASQYLSLLIEVIFGISYNAKERQIKICPLLNEQLKKQPLKLDNLQIDEGIYLSVEICCGVVSAKTNDESVKINVCV